MTPGQQRALRELERLTTSYPDGLETTASKLTPRGDLRVEISIRIGRLETQPEGLQFKERESFVLVIPPDFPFDKPSLHVTHNRFAGFPHVNWATHICLYQSDVEWNPSDGLFGFFDRLMLWLRRAALNDMDPVEGPLHPPVHLPDYDMAPFVIRANTPVPTGQSWLGLVELQKFENRIELVRWNDLSGKWPETDCLGVGIILPAALPVEFPERGKDFFAELVKQGIDKQRVLRDLRIAALLTPKGEHAYIILAMPMRRSKDRQLQHHVAIWAIEPDNAERLRKASPPSENDPSELATIKEEINDLLFKIFELIPMKWCSVMEDRSEIVVRRDEETPVSWFYGKKVLILGCGALGSWAGEIIARATPSTLHLVDNSKVKPGLLARQNYRLDDIGKNKAAALAQRLESLLPPGTIAYFRQEAHHFLIESPGRMEAYDVVLDLTASSKFQMKWERDWKKFKGQTPPIVSMVIDAKARHALGVVLPSNSLGGIWDAFIKLKNSLCGDSTQKSVATAFYSERSLKDLFQPEPGCSDPTFSGSTADVSMLVAGGVNTVASILADGERLAGFSLSAPLLATQPGQVKAFDLPTSIEVEVGGYRIRMCGNVFREAQAWVKQNNRVRTKKHETGGLLWGFWDDAIGVVWIVDASGPPPDSLHDPGHFVCGVQGTTKEYATRSKLSYGATKFVGFWHTHPDMPSTQSRTDIEGMTGLVSGMGLNQRRAAMVIFGRTGAKPTAGIYVYQSEGTTGLLEMVSVGAGQITLESSVV